MLARLSRYLQRVEEFLVGASLGAAALIVILAVVMRYVFDNALPWAEEAPISLLLFSSFVGASLALRAGDHVGIDLLTNFVSERSRTVLRVVALLVTAAYCGVMGVLGWQMIFDESTLNAVTPALGLPVWLVRLALPLGLTLMFLRSLEMLLLAVTGSAEEPAAGSSGHGEVL